MQRFMFSIFVIVMVFAATACMAADPGLVGEWQGPVTLHSAERGFSSTDGSIGIISILEQKDGAFHGEKTWTRNGKSRTEKFSGVISPDGKRIYFAGHDDGYFFGEILGPDEIVVYYLEDGDNPKAMRHQLKRIK